ncbi:MAG: DUF956 family protein [Atopobiaceae bacterium]|nr:DUF956 family protein [Atopobiaceae bacterium]MDO4403527.1 DUF956 family protein [Atopobiaceae bacterium]
MAQSMNSTVDFVIKATSFHGLGVYGNIMVGNNAIEFYNERNPEDYIQIPWTEVEGVAAEVIFGRFIPRFAVCTKESGNFAFSTRDNKATLRAIQKYVPAQNMVKSPSFFDVIKLGLGRLWRMITGRGA